MNTVVPGPRADSTETDMALKTKSDIRLCFAIIFCISFGDLSTSTQMAMVLMIPMNMPEKTTPFTQNAIPNAKQITAIKLVLAFVDALKSFNFF